MKQKKILCAVWLILICLPCLLFAQKSDTFSKMKPGDWFEVLVSDTARKPNNESYRYHIKYRLKKIAPDGNREYQLIFERIRVTMFGGKNPMLGYDSYYPPYEQGISQRTARPSFSLVAGPNGKLLNIKPDFAFVKIQLDETGLRKEYGGTSAELEPVHAETAGVISRFILDAIALSEQNWYNGRLYKDSGLSFLITAAKFPLVPNVVVEGRISNLDQQTRAGLDLYLPGAEKEFRPAEDGSFQMRAFITRGSEAILKMAGMRIPLFLQPGDTLRFSADARDLANSLTFSGNAEGSGTFGMQVARFRQSVQTPEIPYGAKSFSAESFMQAQAADRLVFNRLKAKYAKVLSVPVSRYHELKFVFGQGKERLDYLLRTNFKANPGSPEIFEGFPVHFFKGIDSLPVLMTDYNEASWYISFLNSFHVYRNFKTSQFNGGSSGFFLGDYVLSLNYLRRFPLYVTLADAFEDELGSRNWKDAQKLKPYYDDFVNNCGDTSLTNKVKEKWKALSAWAPGKQIPLNKIRLGDGSVLDLHQFKSKALSITFNFHYPEKLKHLLDRIRKQDPKKVHFLIVQLKEDHFPGSDITAELKKLPQVTYVEVSGNNEDLEDIVQIGTWDVKTFVIDPGQRVVQDNIDDSPEHANQEKVFEEAIKKALAPETMSKEDKAELIRTIGWSAGSILVAFFVFLWIYQVRISRLKKKEALKRQIKELEIKAIRSQMNPHFLFNALNSIQSLINNRRYEQANIYLGKFSLLMRKVLQNSELSFVSLSDELEAVALYGDLEKLRFDFEFSIKVEEGINTALIEIPGMIVQPLVENAILHGIAQKGSDGVLEIQLSREGAYLKIEVKDNGLGLKEKKGPHQHNGFGLKLVRERLEILNEQGANGTLSINPNLAENATGVTVTLTIPID